MPSPNNTVRESIFDKIRRNAIIADIIPRTQAALDWYQKTVNRMEWQITKPKLLEDANRSQANMSHNPVGLMYMYAYDPLTKKELPYYDRFPLVIPLEIYRDGFLGVNLHYLDYKLRAVLLEALMDTVGHEELKELDRMKVSYQLLKGFATYPEARPCIKRYKVSNIYSRILKIPAPDWETAIFLPVEDFKKHTKHYVWRKSKEAIK